MLILDEKAYAEELLKSRKFGNYLKLKDAIILAKYYRYCQDKETREIKKILISISKRLDKNWNPVLQGWKIVSAIKESKKRRIRTAIPIPITQKELEIISKIDNYNLEKILFTLLVYAKILKYNNTIVKPRRKPVLIGLFYVNEKLSNIFSVARVDVRKKQRNEMAHVLFQEQYIDATRYGGFLIKYVFEDSPTEFLVEDYSDLVLYYLRWKGEQVAGCVCGRLFLKKSKNDSLCHRCKQEKRREAWRERQKKHRLQESMSRLYASK